MGKKKVFFLEFESSRREGFNSESREEENQYCGRRLPKVKFGWVVKRRVWVWLTNLSQFYEKSKTDLEGSSRVLKWPKIF